MPSTYSDLKVELIATGEQSGTWGDTTNTNLGTALEEAIVGRANADFPTDADLTITLTNTNATQVARNYILNVTSSVSLSTTRNLIVPAIDKPYIVENNTTGGQGIVVKTSAGTGVTVPNGKTVMVYADSTNVVAALDHIPSLTLGADAIPAGYLNIPASADKTTAYVLTTSDVGKVISIGTGGSVEVPNSVFSAGDAVLIFNNTTIDATLTMTITNAYIAGVDVDVATITLATRGIATILFVSGTTCVVTGNVS